MVMIDNPYSLIDCLNVSVESTCTVNVSLFNEPQNVPILSMFRALKVKCDKVSCQI